MIFDERPHNISINGPDGVGKTTVVELLSASFPNDIEPGWGVHNYDGTWPNMSSEHGSQWWFEECPIALLIEKLLKAYVARSDALALTGKTPILDRGRYMIEATSIATLMIRTGTTLHIAERTVLDIARNVEKYENSAAREHSPILLLHNSNPGLQRLPAWTDRYFEYQKALSEVIQHQLAKGVYGCVIYRNERPPIEIASDVLAHLHANGYLLPEKSD